VPRKAALIARGQDRYTLVNVAASPSAILLDGRPVADKAPLEDGSKVEVFGESFRFEVPKSDKG